MIIRPLGEDDVAQVARWIFDEWGRSIPDLTLDELAEQFRARVGSDQLPLTLVAQNDELVGTASLVASEMNSPLTPWLSCVYVRPDRRGAGLGDLLCSRILAEARRLGYPRCFLSADTHVAYYARRGWQRRSTEMHRGEAISVMERTL